MRRIPRPDLLQAMKESLRDLEKSVKQPHNPEILKVGRTLKEQIEALERQQSQTHKRGQRFDYGMAA